MQYCAKVSNQPLFIYILLGKWKIVAAIYRNIQIRMEYNIVCTVVINLKISQGHLYSST